jgi:predicted nucleotidyltransferase
LTYTLDDLAWVLSKLQQRGVRFVVIGSTVIDLELRRRSFEDDIDVFAFEPSPLVEEDAYREIALREGWDLSYTALGTPKLVVKVPSGSEVIVEVYENIHDFYIPLEILERAPTKRIKGVGVRLIRPEDYIVLKAKAARDTDIEDLRIIKEYIDERRLRIDERIVRADLELLPEEDRRLAESKLRDLGFRV